MNPNALAAKYRSVQVTTSSPGEVLLMLYEGMFRFLAEAQVAMTTKKDRARAGEKVSRVHAILEELLGTLNHKVNPELCQRLQSLYVYSMDCLVDGNIRQDPTRLQEIDRVLRPIYDAWKTVIRNPAGVQEELEKLKKTG